MDTVRVGSKYILNHKLNPQSSRLGGVFAGVNRKTNEEVAIKMEKFDKENKNPKLAYEAKLFDQLKGIPGIPTVYYYGTEGDFNILITSIYGPSM